MPGLMGVSIALAVLTTIALVLAWAFAALVWALARARRSTREVLR